jgi:osmotically inducible protein OsmC
MTNMRALYTTKVAATGGRHGHIHRSQPGVTADVKDRVLETGRIAAGEKRLRVGGVSHAAEFTGQGQIQIDQVIHEDIEVVAEIGLSRNETGGFVLSASLAVTIAGVDQKMAEELVESAHKICPYSNAIRGNVDVGFTVLASERKV